MAGERDPEELTFPAGADLSTYQYRGVILNGAGSVAAFSAGSPIVGILTNKPGAAGRPARVCIAGVQKLEAICAIAPGDVVTCSTDGRGTVLAAGGGAGTGYALGIAVSRAAASADIFEVLVEPSYFVHA